MCNKKQLKIEKTPKKTDFFSFIYAREHKLDLCCNDLKTKTTNIDSSHINSGFIQQYSIAIITSVKNLKNTFYKSIDSNKSWRKKNPVA